MLVTNPDKRGVLNGMTADTGINTSQQDDANQSPMNPEGIHTGSDGIRSNKVRVLC